MESVHEISYIVRDLFKSGGFPKMVLKLALFLHIISAIFWIGGMLFLVLVVAPYLKTISDPKAKSQIYQVVGKQYRFWGWVAIITLLVTGPLILTGLYGLPLSALSDPGFHASGFGKAVAYKLSLVAIIVISSFLHDFWIGPRARSSPRYSSIARLFGRVNLLIALLIVIFAGLMPGRVFADIGAGPGFFTVPAAKIIGPAGMAFAVDTQSEMLIYLRDRRNPPDNVILIKSEEYEIPLADCEADFALLAYVLHETGDRVRLLREIMRILKPGGTLLVLDWEKKAEEKGPPIEERITAKEARGYIEAAGFDVVQASPMNPSHYRVLSRRPA